MPAAKTSVLRVALLGNPNTGKSTLFSALVGVHQRVGNYPGVTVEKTVGRLDHAGVPMELVDLPGLYSLAPRSLDEMVAVDVLLGTADEDPPVDAVVCIVDASNLRRNLYLVSQVLEFGLPTVVAVNMMDVAGRRGVSLDLKRLEHQLGVPVVGIQAHRKIGISRLKDALAQILAERPKTGGVPAFPEVFEQEVSRLEAVLGGGADGRGAAPPRAAAARPWPRCMVRRLLLDAQSELERKALQQSNGLLRGELDAARARLEAADCPVPGIETQTRYSWADRVLGGVVVEPEEYRPTATDRIDRLLTHRLWGTLIFAAVMVVVFQAIFVWAEAPMQWIEDGTGWLRDLVGARLAPGALRSLLRDGVIAGVGGVVIFLPQILILFLFIGVLEDCGYLARAAYLMDNWMVCVGLSGKSFIPMLSSFACAIPGIMAARVIEDRRDRLTTILVAPLMTCSARLPVYALLIAAFIPAQSYLGGLLNLQGLVLAALYALGIVTAVVVALVLKRTVLRAGTPAFLMDLPSYKWPSPRVVLNRVVQRAWLFLRCAGTLILAVSILVWAALYYPHNAETVEAPYRAEQAQLEAELAAVGPGSTRGEQIVRRLDEIDREIVGAYHRQSILGRIGHTIEPVVRPLGWDWHIGCAVIASLPARELVVASLGVIYNVGEDVDTETSEGAGRFHAALRSAVHEGSDPPRKVFTVPVALSIMVFFALCAQCAATLAVVRRETNTWRWPLFLFGYMTALAYIGALITYQVGTWIAS